MTDPASVEIAAPAGLDFAVIDLEHAPLGIAEAADWLPLRLDFYVYLFDTKVLAKAYAAAVTENRTAQPTLPDAGVFDFHAAIRLQADDHSLACLGF